MSIKFKLVSEDGELVSYTASRGAWCLSAPVVAQSSSPIRTSCCGVGLLPRFPRAPWTSFLKCFTASRSFSFTAPRRPTSPPTVQRMCTSPCSGTFCTGVNYHLVTRTLSTSYVFLAVSIVLHLDLIWQFLAPHFSCFPKHTFNISPQHLLSLSHYCGRKRELEKERKREIDR